MKKYILFLLFLSLTFAVVNTRYVFKYDTDGDERSGWQSSTNNLRLQEATGSYIETDYFSPEDRDKFNYNGLLLFTLYFDTTKVTGSATDSAWWTGHEDTLLFTLYGFAGTQDVFIDTLDWFKQDTTSVSVGKYLYSSTDRGVHLYALTYPSTTDSSSSRFKHGWPIDLFKARCTYKESTYVDFKFWYTHY